MRGFMPLRHEQLNMVSNCQLPLMHFGLTNAKRRIARAHMSHSYRPEASWPNRGGHLVAASPGHLFLLCRAHIFPLLLCTLVYSVSLGRARQPPDIISFIYILVGGLGTSERCFTPEGQQQLSLSLNIVCALSKYSRKQSVLAVVQGLLASF